MLIYIEVIKLEYQYFINLFATNINNIVIKFKVKTYIKKIKIFFI